MSTDADPNLTTCPACGHSFEPAAQALQQCPACAEQFFVEVDAEESDEDREAREAIERRIEGEKEKLDTRRIRIVQLERRSLYRNRSWMLVIAFACIGLAGQLIWLGFRAPGDTGRLMAYLVLAVILAFFSLRFFRRARKYRQEADNMHKPDPSLQPDFSPLQNGSQFADQLKKMSKDTDPA